MTAPLALQRSPNHRDRLRKLAGHKSVCLLRLKMCMETLCGLEWYFFAAVGILTALLSVLMDLSVTKIITAHHRVYLNLEGSVLLQFLCWTLYPACLCAVASWLSHYVCPFSTGSGIPEVRTMLAGFEVPHYLSVTNMFTKCLGLVCTLSGGSTVFLGKVGPFVHVSTMMGAYLSRLHTHIQGQNKEDAGDQMMVVSTAVGVASCFGAPISGVLFSIEVACSLFPLKHYLPCFLAASCGALTFRLFAVWSGEEETLQTMFKTNFSTKLPFYPLEILIFVFLGLLCGAVSCLYLCCHRRLLRYTRTMPVLIRMLTTEKVLYSAGVGFLLACVTFPHFAGQFMASKCTMKQILTSLLHSKSWLSPSQNASVLELAPCVDWTSSVLPVPLPLIIFLLLKLWMLLLACTLPIPAGYFMPVFIYGAAVGRLVGESLAYVTSGSNWTAVNPGGYALAGAAAFSGACTQSLSPALSAMELTGQFSHTGPIFISTLIANMVSRAGQRPSFYDNLSISKRLPHLPSLKRVSPRLALTPLGQLLRAPSVLLQKAARQAEVQTAVSTSSQADVPVVDSDETLFLLGYIPRSELIEFIVDDQVKNLGRCLEEVCCVHYPSILLSSHSTVQQAYTVLSVSREQTLFVTDGGKLRGAITWPELKRMLEDLAQDI
ncbi:chloride channel K [Periophthalmus magnuspinnatus]|uniref:chloride channel K n=1 Tax=Periophthalmus magnuspinnatus TaxID=409849 RepID=UPI00145B192E|nr:chloride channel K [Periophthalmus magnuspinnatus]